jgi:ABC-2 type transport system permease protein
MGELRVYATVARLAFRRQKTYRGAMFASLFTNVVFGFLIASLMKAVVAERGVIAGWDATDFVTAAFATQAILGLIAAFGERELSQRVMAGDIATDLTRPVHLEGWTIAQFFGKASGQMLVRTVPTFASGYLMFDLRLPSWRIGLATVVSLMLAMFVAACWWMLVNLSAFWILNAKGTIQFATIVGYLLSGISFPLVLLPSTTRSIVRWMPWASQVQLPVEVFLGKHATSGGLLATWSRQLLWGVVLLGACHVMITRGRHKLVVQGG